MQTKTKGPNWEGFVGKTMKWWPSPTVQWSAFFNLQPLADKADSLAPSCSAHRYGFHRTHKHTHTHAHTEAKQSCHITHMNLAWPQRKHGPAPVINNNGIGYMTCWVMGPLSELIYMALCSNHRPPNVALSKWAFRNIVQFIASQLAPGGCSINHTETHAANDS